MSRNNLRQLAKLAGVSVATASYALRGHPCVAEATRQRVLRAVRKIGYRTNPLVAALMTQVQAGRPVRYHGTIGICYDPAMFPEGRDSLKADRFYQGAVKQAAMQGFETELFRFDAMNAKPAHHARILQARGIQGVLFLPIFQSPVRLELDVQSLAVCCVGYPIVQPDLNRVAHHHFRSFNLAWKQAHALGYRRIGLVLDEVVDARVYHQWMAAYLLHREEQPRSVRIPPFLYRSYEFAASCGAFLRWIRRERPEVIIITDDAPQAWEAILKAGWRVPADIGLLALRTPGPEISGINQQETRIGAVGMSNVISQLYRNEFGVPPEPAFTLVAGRWEPGGTVRRISSRA